MKYDIFISYRRNGGYETAKHLYDLLTRDKYRVSFDIDTLRNGNFDVELLKRIDMCSDFIIILNKGVFDRCFDTDKKADWLRNELAYALEKNKNVIPIMLEGFTEFPDNLPKDICEICTKNGPKYDKYFFDEFYQRLKRFLVSKTLKKSPILIVAFFILVLLTSFFLYIENNYRHKNNYLYGVPPAPTFQEAEIEVPLDFNLGIESGCYESKEIGEGFIISYQETHEDSTYEVIVQDNDGYKEKYFFDIYNLSNASRSWLSYILVDGNKVQINYMNCGNAGYRFIMKIKNIKR